QRAFITLLIFGVLAASIGVLINFRGWEYATDGIAHAIFPGIVAGFIISGTTGVLWGAIVLALLAAAASSFIGAKIQNSDSAIAIVLTALFSLGVVMISTQRNYASGLQELLFGKLLTVSWEQLFQVAVIAGIALLLILIKLRGQISVSFDRTYAQSR